MPRHPFVIRHASQDRVKRSNSDRLMSRDRDAMGRWLRRLEDDVTTGLMKLLVPPVPAQRSGQFRSVQVARDLHPRASISSRTRCNRTPAGMGRSK